MDDSDCDRQADDAGLLAGLARSEQAAFTAIFDQHSAAVYRYAWGLVDDRSDVHDVVQETFLVLWRRRKSIEAVGGSVLPWLLVTCRQTTWNLNRRVRAKATVTFEDFDPAESFGAAASVGAGIAFRPSIAGPAGIDPRYLEDIATCMTSAGWKPIRDVEDASGEYSRDEYYEFEVYPTTNEKFADDWEGCYTAVARSHGVPDIRTGEE